MSPFKIRELSWFRRITTSPKSYSKMPVCLSVRPSVGVYINITIFPPFLPRSV